MTRTTVVHVHPIAVSKDGTRSITVDVASISDEARAQAHSVACDYLGDSAALAMTWRDEMNPAYTFTERHL